MPKHRYFLFAILFPSLSLCLSLSKVNLRTQTNTGHPDVIQTFKLPSINRNVVRLLSQIGLLWKRGPIGQLTNWLVGLGFASGCPTLPSARPHSFQVSSELTCYCSKRHIVKAFTNSHPPHSCFPWLLLFVLIAAQQFHFLQNGLSRTEGRYQNYVEVLKSFLEKRV